MYTWGVLPKANVAQLYSIMVVLRNDPFHEIALQNGHYLGP